MRAFSPLTPSDAPKVTRPSQEIGRVIFTGFGQGGFASGKVAPHAFFPSFCASLARHGLRSYFVGQPAAAAELITGNSCVVHVYREALEARRLAGMRFDPRHAPVFNDFRIGVTIADKLATNRLFSRESVPVPVLAEQARGRIFSNEANASGKDVLVLERGAALDQSRYNTEFIDTRRTFEGQDYHTTVRIMCVGPTIVHAFVRARPVAEGSPSVHAKDTPRHPRLLETLQRQLVDRNIARLERLAMRLAAVLGPGFYAHDILVERDSEQILVCESNFKFNDYDYEDQIRGIAADLPSHRILFEGFPQRSAQAFLAEWRRLGMRAATSPQSRNARGLGWITRDT